MSEFVVIVPDGWTQLDWAYISNNISNMGHSNVIGATTSDIETYLKEGGIIAPEASLIEFKLIEDTYFLVRLG